MTRAICSIAGCGKTVHAGGLCQPHYRRRNRTGSTDNFYEQSVEERFLSYVDKTDSCWYWTGSLDPKGYGKFHDPDQYQRGQRSGLIGAHRWAYEHWVGPIPGSSLDHTCHSNDTSCPGGKTCLHRRCVNPSHLEPVPQRENVMRGRGPALTSIRSTKTHCKRGHELIPANVTRRADGTRTCRICVAIRQAEYRARRGK